MRNPADRIQIPHWKVRIPGWKDLRIERFHLELTYVDSLEGGTESINRSVVEGMAERAAAIFCAQRTAGLIPVYLAPPSAEQMKKPFPDFLCMALTISDPVEDETFDDETLYSRLVCCWFTSDLNRSIEDLLALGIQPFSWEDYAQNWGV